MHSRLYILLSFAILPACTFDATGLGGAATGPSGEASASTGASTSTTDAPGTTLEPASSEVTGSGTGGMSTGPGDSEGTTAAPQPCGDGVIDLDEACDDGEDNGATRPCTPECNTNVCGDGYPLAPDEACDDGNDDDADACRNDCSLSPTCGNGKIDGGETCDDGNAIDTDGCIACKKATCGDGYIEANVESCDDGKESPLCNADCSVRQCGDSKLNVAAGEVCDLGAKNGVYNSGCNADCSGPGNVCGDGIVSTPEERCDTALPLANATCTNACQMIACTPSFIDCDDKAGCEVNSSDDDDHCGDCSTKCGAIEHCDNGDCSL